MPRHHIEKDDEDWFRSAFWCQLCGRNWVQTFPESADGVHCPDCGVEEQIDWQEVESASDWRDDDDDPEEEAEE